MLRARHSSVRPARSPVLNSLAEPCPSGRRCNSRKVVWVLSPPWVQIPPVPPKGFLHISRILFAKLGPKRTPPSNRRRFSFFAAPMTLSGCVPAFAKVPETTKGPTTPVFGRGGAFEGAGVREAGVAAASVAAASAAGVTRPMCAAVCRGLRGRFLVWGRGSGRNRKARLGRGGGACWWRALVWPSQLLLSQKTTRCGQSSVAQPPARA